VPNKTACSLAFFYIQNHPGRSLLGTARLLFLNIFKLLLIYLTLLVNFKLQILYIKPLHL